MLVIANWSLARSRVDIALLGVDAVADRPRSARADAKDTSGEEQVASSRWGERPVRRGHRADMGPSFASDDARGRSAPRRWQTRTRNPASTGANRCRGEDGRRGAGEESV